METIRKDSSHSYEDGITWDTIFETKEKEDGVWLLITQENTEDGIDDVGYNEIELDKTEMLVLYWHLQEVLGEDKDEC
ncbi:MAG: hypothetical protein WC449_04840 [Candidatus Paceibacterota bacterium]